MNETACDICGVSSANKRVTFFREYNKHLCPKHYNQLRRFGEITDSIPKSERDKNDIIMRGEYAEVIIDNVPTGKRYAVLIDAEDVERVSKHKWNVNIQRNRYNYTTVVSMVDKKLVKMHRFILGYYGDLVVDHINGNTLDNRKSNLRIVTPTENKQNVNPVGIYKRSGKWAASFQRDNQQHWVGTFNTAEEARQARKDAIEKYDLARAFVDAKRSGK